MKSCGKKVRMKSLGVVRELKRKKKRKQKGEKRKNGPKRPKSPSRLSWGPFITIPVRYLASSSPVHFDGVNAPVLGRAGVAAGLFRWCLFFAAFFALIFLSQIKRPGHIALQFSIVGHAPNMPCHWPMAPLSAS